MTRAVVIACATMFVLSSISMAQFRAPSPDGLASTETGGRFVGGRTPYYVDGNWIEISYGRPIKRSRDLWGSPEAYGMWLNRGARVWRAGADVSTYLMTEATLIINETEIQPGGYSMFIDLALDDWTLILSNWQPQRQFDPNNKNELWGSYGYTSTKDVVRVPMTLSSLPWSVDQLTWLFLDMTNTGGKIAIMWDTVMAIVPFSVRENAPDEQNRDGVMDPRTDPSIVGEQRRFLENFQEIPQR